MLAKSTQRPDTIVSREALISNPLTSKGHRAGRQTRVGTLPASSDQLVRAAAGALLEQLEAKSEANVEQARDARGSRLWQQQQLDSEDSELEHYIQAGRSKASL